MSHDHDHDHRAFPTKALPEEQSSTARRSRATWEDSFDYVVVGSARVARSRRTRWRRRASPSLVEEGPWIRTRDFGESVYDAFRPCTATPGRSLRGAFVLPLIQGRCVGGSTG